MPGKDTKKMQLDMEPSFHNRLRRLRLDLEEKTGESLNLGKALIFLAEKGMNLVESDLKKSK